MSYASSPYVFTPDPEADNGPALEALIKAGERWIQIAGDQCPIGTTVRMADNDGFPANFLVIEPAPGISKVLIDVSGVGRNPVTPSDPSYAGFDYAGKQTPAGYLTEVADANALTATVNDGSLYSVGDWIIVSDASHDPANYLLPIDGPMEVRQIIAIDDDILTVNQAWKRSHDVDVIVALGVPFFNGSFRGMEFTGNATVGFHIHMARACQFSEMTTTAWRGGTMLLVDNGGVNNLITDCFCTGVQPGNGRTENAWGVSIEGQDGTQVYRSGGQRCVDGFVANYCIDSLIVEPMAHSNSVNIFVGFSSLRTNVLRPFTATPIVDDIVISPDCEECAVFDPRPFERLTGGITETLGVRELPAVLVPAATDAFLITTEDGESRQLLSGAVVLRETDGAVSGSTFEIRSPTDYSGNFQTTNTLRSWLFGMLGAPGSQEWVIVDLTAGLTRFSISATGAVAYGGTLKPFQGGVFDVGEPLTPWRKGYFNEEINAFGGLRVAGNQVVAARRTGWSADTGTARRSSLVTYSGTAGASYDQATIQALMNAVESLSQTQKALKDDLLAHGLIGA